MVYKPTHLRELLTSLNAKPRKALSQNFLIDLNILHKILHTAHIKEGDLVLEIGPGPGALTEALEKSGARVIAIEKDATYAKALRRIPSIEVYQGDFLSFDLSSLPSHAKVISNLPYSLTAPILAKLFAHQDQFSTFTLMVQKEVGMRIVAQPRSSEYSSFSLFCQYHAHVSSAFTVSPNCFYPKPKVQSSVMHFTLKHPRGKNPHLFPLIREAFKQRRKMLRSSLSPYYGPKEVIEKALQECRLEATSRPQELSLENFERLAERLAL